MSEQVATHTSSFHWSIEAQTFLQPLFVQTRDTSWLQVESDICRNQAVVNDVTDIYSYILGITSLIHLLSTH